MNPDQIPYVRFVTRFGVEDRVLAAFMIVGPLVILTLALLGRAMITTAVATGYVVLFVLYIASKGIARGE